MKNYLPVFSTFCLLLVAILSFGSTDYSVDLSDKCSIECVDYVFCPNVNIETDSAEAPNVFVKHEICKTVDVDSEVPCETASNADTSPDVGNIIYEDTSTDINMESTALAINTGKRPSKKATKRKNNRSRNKGRFPNTRAKQKPCAWSTT